MSNNSDEISEYYKASGIKRNVIDDLIDLPPEMRYDMNMNSVAERPPEEEYSKIFQPE